MKEKLIRLIDQIDDNKVLALIYSYTKGLIKVRGGQHDKN